MPRRLALAAAVLLAAWPARADYVLQQLFLNAGCPAGGAMQTVAMYGDIGFAPVTGGAMGTPVRSKSRAARPSKRFRQLRPAGLRLARRAGGRTRARARTQPNH